MLLSNPASIHLGIIEFKVPNEASSYNINSIPNNTDVKQVSLSNPLHYSVTAKKSPTKKSAWKSPLKCKQHQNSTFQDLNAPKVSSLHHSAIGNHSLQDHVSNITVKDVWDIVSLKKAFPTSFDTKGNMPGVYTICLDPSFPQYSMQDVKSPLNVGKPLKSSYRTWLTKASSPHHWANGMGVISDITPETRWFPLYLSRSNPQQSNHPGTLQGSHPGWNHT